MLNEKMIAVMSGVSNEVAERGDLINNMAIALLTRKNLFILGDTGQAKSYAINLFRSRITGTRQFERLLSKQTDEEQLFGRLDLGSLIPGNVAKAILEQDAAYQHLLSELEQMRTDCAADPDASEKWRTMEELTAKISAYRRTLAELHGSDPQVISTGKIPNSEIVFLDEAFKANDGILNALLTALNERRYTNEGYSIDIPVISFFAASNEIPNFSDPADVILRPLYDRFDLKLVTKYVEDREHRLAILEQKQQTTCATTPAATITLEELLTMQEEVCGVTVPRKVNELMDDILCELRRKNIHVSDRKYFGFAPIVQARAWLCGRMEVNPSDLGALIAYLWTTPDEIEKVTNTIHEICENPLGDRIREIHSIGAEALEEFERDKLVNGSRAMIKFRSGFLALYSQVRALLDDVQSDRDRTQAEDLFSDLETMNRQAHNASGFTYATLFELAALQ